MSTHSILEWVISVTSNLLPSQSKTLAALVGAAVRTERLNLATIARKNCPPDQILRMLRWVSIEVGSRWG